MQTPPVQVSPFGDRDRAAGEELGAFAGDRRDGRLGERARDALALEGLERRR